MTNPADPNVAVMPDSGSTAGKALPPRLQRAMSRVTEIGSLPEITTKIVAVVENPRSTAADMHDIVKNDPALATKILKVVNSAFYGLPSQVANLDRAIIMLGLSAVKNIALAASLARFFKGDWGSEYFVPSDLWRHCIAVGVCARGLAQASRQPQPDEYFVAGLVHDMGLLVEAQLFPDDFRTLIDSCAATKQDFCQAERELLGADHQAFGLALATKWRFPPALRYGAGYHHDPRPLQPEFHRVVTLICMADTICCQLQHGFYLSADTQSVTPEMLTLIGIDAEAMAQVQIMLPEKVAEAEQILSPQ
ncbi:MAG TPA: HDOD domain-containing protein [Phycisphaerae bacterium]|nr:HDOD domain-containing protein [Phycisphaerae bacterium]